jgi:hypothetical protein
VTGGAESWALSNKMERALMACERKILGKIYGATYQHGYWRIKFKSPDTVTVVKVRRLEWLGHGIRMADERTVKKLQEGKPRGGRKKGTPSLSLMSNWT